MNERRIKRITHEPESPSIVVDATELVVPVKSNENAEQTSSPSEKVRRRVSFADKVDIIIDEPNITNEDQLNDLTRLPLASETLIEKMDSNLRMLIIKELSKDSQISKPLSKMSKVSNPSDDSRY